jgi:hypothetical protein
MREPLSFREGEMNCPTTVKGCEMETPVPETSVRLGLVKFALMVVGFEMVTAVPESVMLGLVKLLVKVGAERGALAASVVARLVPERLMVDAARVPENVVVFDDTVWFTVFPWRVVMDVPFADAVAAALLAAVSTAESLVSKF